MILANSCNPCEAPLTTIRAWTLVLGFTPQLNILITHNELISEQVTVNRGIAPRVVDSFLYDFDHLNPKDMTCKQEDSWVL